jgi:succinyl-diaminopimelate desuccinylase
VTVDLLGLTEQLCAIPSVSGTEAALADLVEARLRDSPGKLRVDRIGHNIIARTELGRAQRIVLGGHLDTVPANGNENPRRAGDVLHGLGTTDMKGGVAVLLALADGLAHDNLRFDVTLVLYEGEEVADEFNGLRRLFAEAPELVQGDLAILLEPTGGWVEAGCQGTIHVRAIFNGVRSHSARPWMGRNAIHLAAPLLEFCANFDAATVDVDSLDYREALQVVRIEGGIANNVVPDRCEVVINRRYAPSRSLEVAVNEVVTYCTDAGADHVEVLNASMAAPPNLMNPLIAELTGVYDLPVRPKLGWTDVARFAAHGIAACNFGPGDPELAHTKDECVDRATLDACLALLELFVGIRQKR